MGVDSVAGEPAGRPSNNAALSAAQCMGSAAVPAHGKGHLRCDSFKLDCTSCYCCLPTLQLMNN